jgi:hypothetical protein
MLLVNIICYINHLPIRGQKIKMKKLNLLSMQKMVTVIRAQSTPEKLAEFQSLLDRADRVENFLDAHISAEKICNIWRIHE